MHHIIKIKLTINNVIKIKLTIHNVIKIKLTIHNIIKGRHSVFWSNALKDMPQHFLINEEMEEIAFGHLAYIISTVYILYYF